MADADDIRTKAIAIAKRGVAGIKVGDREHRISDPMKLEAFAESQEAKVLDDTHAGMIDIIFENPT